MFEAAKSLTAIYIERKKDIFLLLQGFSYALLYVIAVRCSFTAKNYCLNLPRITLHSSEILQSLL